MEGQLNIWMEGYRESLKYFFDWLVDLIMKSDFSNHVSQKL